MKKKRYEVKDEECGKDLKHVQYRIDCIEQNTSTFIPTNY